MSLAGIGAVMTVEGATDAEVFRAYVKHVLGPTLLPGDIVLLDNLSVHKVSGIQQMLARRRTRLRYLPPYSPDMAPIESCWSKLKTSLAKPRPGLTTRWTRRLRKRWPLSRPRMRATGPPRSNPPESIAGIRTYRRRWQ